MSSTSVNRTPSTGNDPESLSAPLLSSHSQRSLINSTSQVAIVGANVCPIESLDYEIAENEFFKQDWRSRGKIQIFQYVFMKWSLCFLIGLVVSLLGFFNNLAVENIAGSKFVITSNMMFSSRYSMAFTVFSLSNLVLTLFASVITAFIAPAAAGSGIPEVKAYLNGVDAPAVLSFRTLVVKDVTQPLLKRLSRALSLQESSCADYWEYCCCLIVPSYWEGRAYGAYWRMYSILAGSRRI